MVFYFFFLCVVNLYLGAKLACFQSVKESTWVIFFLHYSVGIEKCSLLFHYARNQRIWLKMQKTTPQPIP